VETIFAVLTKGMKLFPGITDDKLAEITDSLPYHLPKEFTSFLKFSNGVRGMIGHQYLVIVKAEELLGLNNDNSVQIYAPKLLVFGTNGAGEAFGFDYRNNKLKVVMVPLIGLEWAQAIIKGDNFLDFLENLHYEKNEC
jgi:hypothetical protein